MSLVPQGNDVEVPAALANVLVVEDNAGQRKGVTRLLESEHYRVTAVGTGEEGLQRLSDDVYDIVLLDLELPGIDGMSVLSAGPSLQADAQFIVMTGAGSIDIAVQAMQSGAFDFLTKPFPGERLLVTIERALEQTHLRREVAQLRRAVGKGGVGRIIGNAPSLRRALDLVERVAPTRAAVLITGETGTGKELVARAVHDLSEQARGRFVAVNCAALSESLLESELFGHVKGAFTGAVKAKRGLIEEASGGTLFLDEIGDIPISLQVKLLRVLQERSITPVGGTAVLSVDFRLVTATNRDLKARVASGAFREDLFYRLNTFPIEVPPLRDRREDIPLLANLFRARAAEENALDPPDLPAATLSLMMAYDWPGNVRELESFIERAVIMHAGSGSIPFESPAEPTAPPGGGVLDEAQGSGWPLERVERSYILEVLQENDWNQTASAEILGINRSTLYRKLVRYREEGVLPRDMSDADLDGSHESA